MREQIDFRQKRIPKSQAWYWTKQWQQWEREAAKDMVAGKVEGFDTAQELLADLN